eukprot:CAMPEP_0117752800 /NCGR_PEP_ID=MMETSP0947-20121206/11839_1 /TAXON_ID=44440 /ORGANISM="Chattonella subsalsa, Strain CCMP2191" /LENGTH=408 /DNA_ID=CAMNT_0005571547 /DNA_START=90 /DNA_END=1316 /DNA_ORIENTATION=+
MDLFKFGKSKPKEVEFSGPFESCVVELPLEDEMNTQSPPQCFHSVTSDHFKVTVSKKVPEYNWTVIRHIEDFRRLEQFLQNPGDDEAYKPPTEHFPTKKIVEVFGLPLSAQQEQERADELRVWLNDILGNFVTLTEETKGELKTFFSPSPASAEEEKDATEGEDADPVTDLPPSEPTAPEAPEELAQKEMATAEGEAKNDAIGVEERKNEGDPSQEKAAATEGAKAEDDKPTEEKAGLFTSFKNILSGSPSPKEEEEAKPMPPRIQEYLEYAQTPNAITVQVLMEGRQCEKHYVGRDRSINPRGKVVWLSTQEPATIFIDSAKKATGRKGVALKDIETIARGYATTNPNASTEANEKTVVVQSSSYTLAAAFSTYDDADGFQTTMRYLRYCTQQGLPLTADNSEYRES